MGQPNPFRTTLLASAVGLAAVVSTAAVGCGGQPKLLPFPLSQQTLDACEGNPALAGSIEFQLVRLFRQAESARYLVLDAWRASGFDPNEPAWGALTGDLLEGVVRDNRQRYYDLLEDLRAGERDVKLPSSLKSLQRSLGDSAPEPQALAEAVETFHPSLTDAAYSYARQCTTCHGLAGRGDGPSARYQNPPPRDYGAEAFRHYPKQLRERPAQLDMLRVLREGVSGSGMPRFSSRPLGELSGLVDYVRFLAIRAEVERALTERAARGETIDTESTDAIYAAVVERWRDEPAEPDELSEAVELPEADAEEVDG
jgi:mono/diheme cytochrome c family protein